MKEARRLPWKKERKVEKLLQEKISRKLEILLYHDWELTKLQIDPDATNPAAFAVTLFCLDDLYEPQVVIS